MEKQNKKKEKAVQSEGGWRAGTMEPEEGEGSFFASLSFRHDKMVKFGKPEATCETVEKGNSCGRGQREVAEELRATGGPRENDGNRRNTR